MSDLRLYLPFCTYHRDNPDFNESDNLSESGLLIQRQELITDCVDGLVEAEIVLDCLESQGIDPVAYVEMVEANVNYLISQGL